MQKRNGNKLGTFSSRTWMNVMYTFRDEYENCAHFKLLSHVHVRYSQCSKNQTSTSQITSSCFRVQLRLNY